MSLARTVLPVLILSGLFAVKIPAMLRHGQVKLTDA